MMGQHGGNQDRLFHSFNLGAHVPVWKKAGATTVPSR
jgi:hypothetical protein